MVDSIVRKGSRVARGLGSNWDRAGEPLLVVENARVRVYWSRALHGFEFRQSGADSERHVSRCWSCSWESCCCRLCSSGLLLLLFVAASKRAAAQGWHSAAVSCCCRD